MKRAVVEPESAALESYLDAHPEQVSCTLVRVEVVRASRALGAESLGRARQVVAQIPLIELDDELLTAAAEVEPWTLRSLDALHLAAALTLADALEAFVTYDRRLREAAEFHGLRVEAPA